MRTCEVTYVIPKVLRCLRFSGQDDAPGTNAPSRPAERSKDARMWVADFGNGDKRAVDANTRSEARAMLKRGCIGGKLPKGLKMWWTESKQPRVK